MNSPNEKLKYSRPFMPDMTVRLDKDGRYLEVLAPSAVRLFLSEDEVVGKNIKDMLPSDRRETVLSGIKAALKTGKRQLITYPVFTPAGDIWLEMRIAPDGRREEVTAHILEITGRRNAEKKLQSQLEFEKMVSDIASGFIASSVGGLDEQISDAVRRAGVFLRSDFCGLYMMSCDGNTADRTHFWAKGKPGPAADKPAPFPVNRLRLFSGRISRRRPFYIRDIEDMDADLEERVYFADIGFRSVLCLPLGNAADMPGFLAFAGISHKLLWSDSQVSMASVVARILGCAVTRQRAELKLKHQTYHDPLTGLYNRTFFEEEVKRLNVVRQLPLSLIMCDVNGLKLINDRYGYCHGDSLLKKTASILRMCCRREDIIARWGGDEFIVLLPQTGEKETERVRRRIMKRCADKHGRDRLPLSFALGNATKDSAEQPVETIHEAAAEKMRENKKITKNNCPGMA